MKRFGIYYTGKDDQIAIYHMRSGKPLGIPIAFVRDGMRQSVEYLVDAANAYKKKSIFTKNNRPGGE